MTSLTLLLFFRDAVGATGLTAVGVQVQTPNHAAQSLACSATGERLRSERLQGQAKGDKGWRTFTALPDDALPDLGAAFLAALGAAFLNRQVVTCLEPCVRATTLFTRALPMKVEVAIFGGGVGWRWSLRTPNPRVRSVDRTRRNTPQPCPRPWRPFAASAADGCAAVQRHGGGACKRDGPLTGRSGSEDNFREARDCGCCMFCQRGTVTARAQVGLSVVHGPRTTRTSRRVARPAASSLRRRAMT
jgi:hypothetical protein